jgi:hypothetical protein
MAVGHSVKSSFHIAGLPESSLNERVQMWVLRGGEENGRGGQTQAQIRRRRFACKQKIISLRLSKTVS